MNKKKWTPIEVEKYLKNLNPRDKKILPDDAYCTDNFTWNEVLRTKNRNISIPTIDILENLQYSAENLQKYRTEIKRPIVITSSWRTPLEQNILIEKFNKGELKNKPSNTSLHLEGLALDFVVPNSSQKEIQNLLDRNHLGELEMGEEYTHAGLPTFSKQYLERNKIYSDKIYRKLNGSEANITDLERQKIIKRLNPKTWQNIESKYNPSSNAQMFKNTNFGQATGYAAPVEDTINQNNYKSYTTFTPEEIGRMSPQEFARNEKAIMQQLKHGQIKPTSVQNVDFKSFKNPENGKSTIFTREDIEKMSTKEFTKNEKAINAQMKSVGIPYKKEVPTGTPTYAKEKVKTAVSSNSGSSENGRWVTINGNHVFLEKDGK